MYKVQSVVIKKPNFNLDKSSNWIVRNGFQLKKVDETKNTFRFRQLNPASLRKEGFNHYVNKPISDDISLVIAYKK